MNADTVNIRTILSFERRYVVPTFQRDYEWTKDDQWALLFEDLEAVAARLKEARRSATAKGEIASKAEARVTPHFLGAVVLDQLPSSAGGLDLRAVVDGQQRLTTLQLLVRGLLDVVDEIGSPRTAQLRRLIENPEDVIRLDYERHKLWPRRRDREVWVLAMADEDSGASDHPYLQARRYFRETTKTAIQGPDPIERADLLADAFLSLFKLVVIDLEENDDAQVIFEVLNGRQTPLSASDLVKNLLFLRAELADERELDQLYEQYWSYFDHEWWKKDMGRGHAARDRRDVLLSTWLTAASGSEVSIGNLYGDVRRYVNASDRKVGEVLSEIREYSGAFRAIEEPDESIPKEVRTAYSRLTQLGVFTVLPLLSWLRTLEKGRLSASTHESAVRAVESWVVRRLIVGANTRGYGKHFLEVLQAAQKALRAGKDAGRAVCRELAGAKGTLRWPTDDEVTQSFSSRAMYGTLTQDRLRMLLGAIDKWMQVEHLKGERPNFNYDALQIEHLLPQEWRMNWPVTGSDEAARLLAEQVRDRAFNRIGNLTLVTDRLNPAMSNAAWAMKREALRDHSKLELNAEVISLPSWDESAMEKRALRLAAVACLVWPSATVLRASTA
jgi:hypothetical protein